MSLHDIVFYIYKLLTWHLFPNNLNIWLFSSKFSSLEGLFSTSTGKGIFMFCFGSWIIIKQWKFEKRLTSIDYNVYFLICLRMVAHDWILCFKIINSNQHIFLQLFKIKIEQILIDNISLSLTFSLLLQSANWQI